MGASVSGIKMGKAFIVIDALNKTDKVISQVESRFMKLGSRLTQIGTSTMLKVAAALTPHVFSSRLFADFDDSLRKVEARSAGTASEMDAIRKQAKALGGSTAFTAGQIGELQNQIAQKGFKRGEIFAMTEPITDLAIAAGEGKDMLLDAQNAASLVGGTLRAYGMDASKAGHLSDLFTETVNSSNYTLEELITSMQYAAPIAAKYGIKIESLLASLAGMKDVNLDASIAGTAMRNMILYMSQTKGQEKFNEQLKDLTGNTIAFTDAQKNLKDPTQLLFEIGEAVKGLGTAEQGDILSELFGTRAVIPAMAIIQGKNPFDEMLAKLQNVNGVAAKTRQTMDSGLGGAFRNTMSAVEATGIAFVESFEKPLIGIANKIQGFLGTVTVWMETNKGLTMGLAAIVPLAGLVAASIFALGVTFKALAIVLAVCHPLILVTKIAWMASVAVVNLLTAALFSQVAAQTATRAGYLGLTAAMTITNTVAGLLQGTIWLMQVALTVVRAALLGWVMAIVLARAQQLLLVGVEYLFGAAVAANVAAVLVYKGVIIGLISASMALRGATTGVAVAFGVARIAYIVAGAALTYLTAQYGIGGVAQMVYGAAVYFVTQALTVAKLAYFTVVGVLGILTGVTTGATTATVAYRLATLIASAIQWTFNAAVTAATFVMQLFTLQQWLTIGALLATTGAITLVKLALAGLSALIAALSSPIGLAVVAVAALGAVLYLNRKTIFAFMQDQLAALWQALQSIGSGITQWFSSMMAKGAELGATLKSTFLGIQDAMMIGDMDLAWNIAMDGLMLAWTQVVDMFMETWNGFTGYFIEAWHGAMASFKEQWYGAQKTISQGMIDLAREGGFLGDMMDLVLGVDVSGEDERSNKLDEQLKASNEALKAKGVNVGDSKLQNSVDQAKEGLGKEYDQKIKDAQDAAGQALSDRQGRINEAQVARQAEIEKRKAALNARLKELEEKVAAAKQKAIDDAAGKIQGAFGGGPPDDLANQVDNGKISDNVETLTGLEQGTVEAAKQALENQMRSDDAAGLAIQQAQLQALQRIDANLKNNLDNNINVA